MAKEKLKVTFYTAVCAIKCYPSICLSSSGAWQLIPAFIWQEAGYTLDKSRDTLWPITNEHLVHVYRLWEEAKATRVNPHRHEEDEERPQRFVTWTFNFE